MALSVAALFAGIGGIESGLERHGFEADLFCEIDPHAKAVLEHQFGLPVHEDVRELKSVPEVDLLTAGFPCQDLSQAGRKSGIEGANSSLVEHVFRLCEQRKHPPESVLIENVSYMLRLDKGQAMKMLVSEFEGLGYRWAYRVVDARAFGMPQRRQRVLFLASRERDPGAVLFADDADDPSKGHDRVGDVDPQIAHGFYWTEGLRGLGWVRDAVPTIKGGSSVGIPSAPCVWIPETGEFGTPQLHDLERLQGFPAGWTKSADGVESGRRNSRYRLIGNAVCVPMAEWVGRRLTEPGAPVVEYDPIDQLKSWPKAAAGNSGEVFRVNVGMRPLEAPELDLRGFLQQPLKPLSERASRGFLSRAHRSSLRFPKGMLSALEQHADRIAEGAPKDV